RPTSRTHSGGSATSHQKPCPSGCSSVTRYGWITAQTNPAVAVAGPRVPIRRARHVRVRASRLAMTFKSLPPATSTTDAAAWAAVLRRDGRRSRLEGCAEEAARIRRRRPRSAGYDFRSGPARYEGRHRRGRALELVQPADHEAVEHGDADREHRE